MAFVMRARYWDYEAVFEHSYVELRDGEYDPTTYKGVGWVTKDGQVTHIRAHAKVYDSEAEAWEHASAADLVGRSKDGEDWCWPEEVP